MWVVKTVTGRKIHTVLLRSFIQPDIRLLFGNHAEEPEVGELGPEGAFDH